MMEKVRSKATLLPRSQGPFPRISREASSTRQVSCQRISIYIFLLYVFICLHIYLIRFRSIRLVSSPVYLFSCLANMFSPLALRAAAELHLQYGC